MPLITYPNYNVIKILGIDPGLNTTGISITELDTQELKILSIRAYTLKTQYLTDRSLLDDEHITERVIKLERLSYAFSNILMEENPSVVVSESPFYNPTRPAAFGALVEVINTLQRTLLSINANIRFCTVSPYEVKRSVKAGQTLGKESVKEMMVKVPEIMNVLISDFNQLDEHSIDAVAVMYAWLQLQKVY